jgi:mannosyl-oligosaccharide alpha-1,2-mannosidase
MTTDLSPTRRHLLAGAGAACLASAPLTAANPDWRALAEDVRAEMRWAWSEYRRLAWGKDQIKPISGGSESFPLKDHHLGLSLIEAMDTLWLMGLDTEFAEAEGWVRDHLDFAVDGDVSVFETIIRLVGGLLSAHLAGGDPVVLAKARDLADRLLPAFDTPTGMPYRFVNLATKAVRDPMSNPAETGSCIAEFGTLSHLTGDNRYYDIAKRAQVAMFDRRSKIGLIPDRIDVRSGEWTSRRATIAPPADSFYEYCWDGWDLFRDADYKRMYDVLTAAILKHQQKTIGGKLWFVDVDYETGALLSTEQDELAAFYGGLLAQGGAIVTGRVLTRSWVGLQDRFGVLPEGYQPIDKSVTAPGNALRPELADAAFNLWLIDRRDEWRQVIATHYRNMKRWNRAAYGYADLANVITKEQRDACPGYWWSEQMKYYWLAFSDTPRFDYKSGYLSTEGNVLRGFNLGKQA